MRRLSLIAACAFAAAAVAAAPSSANVPNGQGLEDFGVFNCEGLGEVSVFGPRGLGAATSFATTGEHAVLLSLSITGTDAGEPFSSFKSYGQKRGLTPLTCTQHVEDGQIILDATAVVAIVPPR